MHTESGVAGVETGVGCSRNREADMRLLDFCAKQPFTHVEGSMSISMSMSMSMLSECGRSIHY